MLEPRPSKDQNLPFQSILSMNVFAKIIPVLNLFFIPQPPFLAAAEEGRKWVSLFFIDSTSSLRLLRTVLKAT